MNSEENFVKKKMINSINILFVLVIDAILFLLI